MQLQVTVADQRRQALSVIREARRNHPELGFIALALQGKRGPKGIPNGAQYDPTEILEIMANYFSLKFRHQRTMGFQTMGSKMALLIV